MTIRLVGAFVLTVLTVFCILSLGCANVLHNREECCTQNITIPIIVLHQANSQSHVSTAATQQTAIHSQAVLPQNSPYSSRQPNKGPHTAKQQPSRIPHTVLQQPNRLAFTARLHHGRTLHTTTVQEASIRQPYHMVHVDMYMHQPS